MSKQQKCDGGGGGVVNFLKNVINGHYDIDISNKLIFVRTEIQVIT